MDSKNSLLFTAASGLDNAFSWSSMNGDGSTPGQQLQDSGCLASVQTSTAPLCPLATRAFTAVSKLHLSKNPGLG